MLLFKMTNEQRICNLEDIPSYSIDRESPTKEEEGKKSSSTILMLNSLGLEIQEMVTCHDVVAQEYLSKEYAM